jgi:phage terminase large subunit
MIELNPKFKEILTTDKRIIIVTGGRGSSKSFSIATIANLLTYEVGHRILFTRYTMTSAKISVIPEFEEKIALLGVQEHFAVRQNQIVNRVTGCDIIFRGLRAGSSTQTANLKSIQGITTWILDEAEELVDQDVYDKLNLSIRSKAAKNRIILVLNPTTIDHWIWKEYFEMSHRYDQIEGFDIPMSTHPDVLHIHVTYKDNEQNLSESFLADLEKTKINKPNKYKHKIIGGWLERSEGVVFENWQDGFFPSALPYVYVQDLGYFPDPLTLVKIAVDKKKSIIYIDELVYDVKLSNEDIIRKYRALVKRRRDLILTDTNEPRLSANLKKEGFNMKKVSKRKVTEGIREMQDYLIVVTKRSYNVKRELRLYVWNNKKASIPVDSNNHAMDAMRYGYEFLTTRRFKMRKKN